MPVRYIFTDDDGGGVAEAEAEEKEKPVAGKLIFNERSAYL